MLLFFVCNRLWSISNGRRLPFFYSMQHYLIQKALLSWFLSFQQQLQRKLFCRGFFQRFLFWRLHDVVYWVNRNFTKEIGFGFCPVSWRFFRLLWYFLNKYFKSYSKTVNGALIFYKYSVTCGESKLITLSHFNFYYLLTIIIWCNAGP